MGPVMFITGEGATGKYLVVKDLRQQLRAAASAENHSSARRLVMSSKPFFIIPLRAASGIGATRRTSPLAAPYRVSNPG